MTVRSSTRTWTSRGLAVAAATASAVALGGLSSAAHADSAWDQLADCESNQRWDINTGNGYYGGLQFAKSSWDAAGGQQYANYPHEASRSEQIAVAENLLAMQGAGAWPACTDALGLTTADLAGSGEAAPASDDTADEGADEAPEQAEQASNDSDDSRDADDANGSDADDASDDAVATDGFYTVEAGDTLAGIAARLDVDGGWKALFEANDDLLSEPGLIVTGQELALPEAAVTATYQVRAGDTLSSIADAESVAGGWKALYDANADVIADPGLIVIGQVLDLP